MGFAGDWAQTLPGVPRGGVANILNATLQRSNLWRNIEQLKLTENMRLKRDDMSEQEANDIKTFAECLAQLGSGRCNESQSFVKSPPPPLYPFNSPRFLHSRNRFMREQDDYRGSQMPIEYLNSLEFPGLPLHETEFKVGAPIMLNLDPGSGLCNGTRLLVTALGSRVIKAKVITGDARNQIVLIL